MAATGATKKDYDLFLQDLEEDPEFRQQVNLYRDNDIMKDLEAKIGAMTLDDEKPSKSERVMKKAKRKTEQGKASAEKAEEVRKKNKLIMKANLKEKKDDVNDEDNDYDSDWESIEDDAPVVKLEELLANMHIKGEKDEN